MKGGQVIGRTDDFGWNIAEEPVHINDFHATLLRASFIYLACEPELSSFYERWDFKTYEGRAEWMIKVQREE